MRTTVTLDKDVEQLLRKLIRERGISFKKALNDAIRRGFENTLDKKGRKPYRLKPVSMGAPAEIRWDKILSMAEALEDEELVRKLHLRK